MRTIAAADGGEGYRDGSAERVYVAERSRDPADRLLALTVMDEPLVIFRTDSGVHMMDDRCPPRHLPLSMGTVDGETIRCGCHGMLIDRRLIEPERAEMTVRAAAALASP